MADKTIKLTKEQQDAHDSIIDWFKSDMSPYISVGGLAGTGKTTLIGFITKTLQNEDLVRTIAYVAYTGKASTVLKSKIKDRGWNDYVGTIHSLIYIPIKDKDTGEIKYWGKRDEIDADLIVLDEASMVDKDIWKDLLSYDIPILVVGDHGQLPPIGENNFSLMKNPDIKLETIHRQALDNPIIKLSLLARENGFVPNKVYGKNVAKFEYVNPTAQRIFENYNYNGDSQILCGTNKTRVKLNAFVRSLNNFDRIEPHKGERLICLKNNKRAYVMNGHMGYLEDATIVTDMVLNIKVRMDGDEFPFDCFTHRKAFGKVKYDVIQKESWKDEILNGVPYDPSQKAFINIFDYGYAISVHKSQGSEFNRVLLIDERNPYQSDEDYARWLYTGITRASNMLVIIDNYY